MVRKAAASAPPEPVRLTFRSEQHILVESDNEDRFMMTMREAAYACKQAQDKQEWQDDFKKFLHEVHQWCEAHAGKVEAGYVGVGDGSLNVFVCTKSADYDFDIDDELTELDIDLVKNHPWLVAEVLQIPEQTREDQILSDTAILVYGNGRQPPRAG